MGLTAEPAANIWKRQQETMASGTFPEAMSDALDQELAVLEGSLNCLFVDWFYADKTNHLEEEEAKAWTQWFKQLNNGDGGVWSELSDRMQALYDAEECYSYDCYRLRVEKENVAQ